MKESFIRCSICQKQVSTLFISIGELIIRAFVQCPECIEDEVKKGVRKWQ